MTAYDRVPQPFVLRVPGSDELDEDHAQLRWGLRLFGSAMRYWPYAIHAFQTAGQRGLGRAKCQVELEEVRDALGGTVLWGKDQRASAAEPTSAPIARSGNDLPNSPHERCTLRWIFNTPVRLRNKGRLNPSELDGLSLLLAARRRHAAMEHCHGPGQAERPRDAVRVEADAFETLESDVRPWSFKRFSGRQRRPMRLDGLTGRVVIRGPWGAAAEAIHAMPALHLGKATSFGFGSVNWELL
jgi:hypothetical protein